MQFSDFYLKYLSNLLLNGVPKVYCVAPLCPDRTMILLLEVRNLFDNESKRSEWQQRLFSMVWTLITGIKAGWLCLNVTWKRLYTTLTFNLHSLSNSKFSILHAASHGAVLKISHLLYSKCVRDLKRKHSQQSLTHKYPKNMHKPC